MMKKSNASWFVATNQKKIVKEIKEMNAKLDFVGFDFTDKDIIIVNKVETKYKIDWNQKIFDSFAKNNLRHFKFVKRHHFTYDFQKISNKTIAIKFQHGEYKDFSFYILLVNDYALRSKYILNFKSKKFLASLSLFVAISVMLFLASYFLFPIYFGAPLAGSIFLIAIFLYYMKVLWKYKSK